MIKLTKLNGQEVYINNDLIEKIEEKPDTFITLVDGKKIIVKETAEIIIEKIVQFKRRVLSFKSGV